MKAGRYAWVVVAISLFLTLTGTGFAADNWTGFYVGANGGYGWGKAHHTFSEGGSGWDGLNLFSPDDAGGSFHNKIDGAIFGGHAGFNYQTGINLVAGLEASFHWSDVKGDKENVFPNVPNLPIVSSGTTKYETKLRWFGTVTPRVGFAISNFLPYVKGGVAFGRLKSTLTSNNSVLGNHRFADASDHIGWTAGGGIDYALGHWVFGVEYNYYDFGTQHLGGTVSPDTTWTLDYKLRSTVNDVMMRVSYKFH
jgi:outer membrane immunogenic protein